MGKLKVTVDRSKTMSSLEKSLNSDWKNPKSTRPRNIMDKNIADNMWKTKKTAAYFHTMTGLPKDELESVARMCLMKSALSYNPDKPANFSTWVNRCLHLHLMNYLRDKSRLLKMPRKYTEIYLKSNKARKANPDITIRQMAKEIEVDEYELREVLRSFSAKILDIFYFEEEVLGGGDGEIDDDLLKDNLNLDQDKIAEENNFDLSVVKDLKESDVYKMNAVLFRGLCDNTLRRLYKTSAVKVIEEVDNLMERVYFLI